MREAPELACLNVTICRDWEDGWTLIVRLHELDGRINEHVERLYHSSTDASDVVNDACRVMSGWGALGALGLSRACEEVRAGDRY